MSEGNQGLIQELSVEDYVIVPVNDTELNLERSDLHFVLKLEEFPVANLQIGYKMLEVDAKIFLEILT